MATQHLTPRFSLSVRAALASALLLGLAACGGSIDSVGPDGSGGPASGGSGSGGSGGTGGGSGGGGSGGGSLALSIEGSYDLTFTQASATFQGGGGVPTTPSPSAGKSGRLDIRTEKSNGAPAYEAVLTARWGQASTYAVTVTDSVVTLDATSGGAAFGGPSSAGYVSDTWEQITLERASDGTLTGVVHGKGGEQVSMGDEIWQGDVTGAGKLAHDTTVPEVRATLTSPQGPANLLLPWDPIYVALAEPLDGQTTIPSLEVDIDDVGLPMTWKQGAATSVGTVSLTGRLTSWTAANGASTFTHAGGVSDPSANKTAPSNATFNFLSLPQPLTQHTFDGFDKVATVTPWGSATQIEGSRCESVGCMAVGPYLHQGCGAARNGFAGQLQAPQLPPGGTTPAIHVRYRILAKSSSGSGAPEMFVAPMTVEIATPGSAATETGVGNSSASYAQLPSAIDGMTYGTAWTTLDIPLPSAAAAGQLPIGFAVRAGDVYSCGGPPMPTNQVEILVDSIAIN